MPVKIIFTIALLLAVPAARGDAKDDLCESYRLGIKGYEGVADAMPGVLKVFGFDLAETREAYQNLCGSNTASLESIAAVFGSDFVCSAAEKWQSGVSQWVKTGNSPGFKFSRTIMENFEKAVIYGLRAMGQLCP